MAMTLLAPYLDVFEFVNADEIARGLNPLRPASANVMAGRVMIERIANLIEAKASFAFETTCAGHHHAETIRKARVAGYVVTLVFLWLPTAEAALQRVRARVKQGGHDIPEATVRRRYAAGLKNLVTLFLPLVDKAVIYDNTAASAPNLPKIAEKGEGRFQVVNQNLWHNIEILSRQESHD